MKRTHTLLTVMAAIFLFASCGGGDSFENKIEYLPFKSDKDSNWGLISPDGKVLFDDEFEKCPTMVLNERFFVETKDGYELYAAEEKPKQVGDKVWKEVCDFTEDVTPAVEKGKPIALINRDGEVVKELDKINGKSVVFMQRFTEGLAIYKNIDGYYGAIDTDGEVVIDANYIKVNTPNDGKIVAIDKKYESAYKAGEKEKVKYAVLDLKGNLITELDAKKFEDISGYYHEGLMAATVKKGDKTCAGLLNEKGEWEVEPSSKVADIRQWRGKYFVFENSEDKCGIMSFDGEVVLRAKYDGLFFIEDDVLVKYDSDKERDERYCLIDLEGEKIGTKTFRDFKGYGIGGTKYGIIEIEEDNYAFIDGKGELLELEKGLDIYDIRYNSAGYIVESDFVDMGELVAALGLTKDGMDGFKVGTPAEAAIKQAHANDSTISVDAEDYTYRSQISYSKNLSVISPNIAVTFDSYAGEAIKQTVTENYYGYTFTSEKTVGHKFSATAAVNSVSTSISTSYGKMENREKELFKAVSDKLKGLGKVAKSNEGAIVVSTGENKYAVAFINGKTVVFGVAAGSAQDFDISQYGNSGEEVAVDSVEVEPDYMEEEEEPTAVVEMQPDDFQ